MATPDELRANIDAAREVFRATLASVSGHWERKPQVGEGEDSWSARQVAEHAIGTEVFIAKAICDACGYPGAEPKRLSLATPQEALAAFDEAVETSNSRIRYVTETDLPKAHERFGNVQGLMELAAHHLEDHAQQIQAATS